MKFETDIKCNDCKLETTDFKSKRKVWKEKYYRIVIVLVRDISHKSRKWHLREVKLEGERNISESKIRKEVGGK